MGPLLSVEATDLYVTVGGRRFTHDEWDAIVLAAEKARWAAVLPSFDVRISEPRRGHFEVRSTLQGDATLPDEIMHVTVYDHELLFEGKVYLAQRDWFQFRTIMSKAILR